MLNWIKNNKALILSIVVSILQNIGVVPPAVDAVSVDTKQAP